MIAVAMSLLAIASLICFAFGPRQSFITGWVPALVMSASMLAMCVYATVGIGATALLVAVPALFVAAMLSGRGPDKLMAAHRGLSAVAMGLLTIKALAATGDPLSPDGSGHAAHASAPLIDLLMLVLIASAVVSALVLSLRVGLRVAAPAQTDSAAGRRRVPRAVHIRAAHSGSAHTGSANMGSANIVVARRFERAEVLLMVGALVLMTLHPS